MSARLRRHCLGTISLVAPDPWGFVLALNIPSRAVRRVCVAAGGRPGRIILTVNQVREGGVTRSRRTEDPKVAALRETRCLNPHPEAVTDERFTSSDFFDARDLAQVKYEMVRAVRAEDMPITVAAAGFGLSRQSFYQAAAALDGGACPRWRRPSRGPRAGTSSPTRCARSPRTSWPPTPACAPQT